MRIAVAGTGSIGRRHIAHLQELLPELRLVLLRQDQRIDDYSKTQRAEVVPNLSSALLTPLDAIVIATPSALHADLVREALAAGLAMYVEKPLVTNSVQLVELQAHIASCASCPPTQMGCNLRFLPSLQRMRQLVHAGLIGRLVRCSFEAGQWLPDWRPLQNHRCNYSADPYLGGGVLLDLIHEIDAARWILGQLSPVACQLAPVPSLQINSEGAAMALLCSDSGALVHIGLDYVARRPLRRYQLIGELGTIVWDLGCQSLVLQTVEGQQIIDCGDGGFDVSATYRTAMQTFINSLNGELPLVQPFEDGLASASLAIALKDMSCHTR